MSASIITLNEEKNIARAIESVRSWVQEVVVVDSGSTDHTLDIARSLGARVIQNPWRGYGQQKNFAQSKVTHDWVLNLDADEAVTPELALEIQNLLSKNEGHPIRGYLIPRLSFYLGRWIRHGGWYPNRSLRLYHRQYAKWSEPDVHEECIVEGAVQVLSKDLLHYPFSKIEEQIETNLKFSRLGAEKLKKKGMKKNLALLILKPLGKFIETYILKKGFLDGMAGLIISVNAAHSIFLKYAYFFEEVREPHQ